MKKILSIIAVIALFSFANQKEYTFKFTEAETGKIIQSIIRSETMSAKEASDLINKIQQQANDTTLNPRK